MSLEGSERFSFDKELADTLQGRIYIGTDKKTKESVVIKEAWKVLVHSFKSRKGHHVPENFCSERDMQLWLSSLNDCHPCIVKAISSWEEQNCYYLAMERCHGELFDFISKQHSQGEIRKLVLNEQKKEQKVASLPNAWLCTVQKMFAQLVHGVAWLHSKGVCHLDLSLENSLLQVDNDDTQTKHCCKIIDFGLARKFSDGNFMFQGRVGKVQYMAPEAYANGKYDARAADIYCLGVMLFMMVVGAPPYKEPHPRQPAFTFVINGHIPKVLTHWKRLRLVTQDALDLLMKMFRYEKSRIKMDELLQHAFIVGGQSSKEKVHDGGKQEEMSISIGGSDCVVGMRVKKQMSSEKPMKRLAKMKLEEWGFAKYIPKMQSAGYNNLGQFHHLVKDNGCLLLKECGFSLQDAALFVSNFSKFSYGAKVRN